MATFTYRTMSRECPVELVFAIAGQRWKARILFRLSRGPARFSELRTHLPGVSDKVLTTALRELEAYGFLSRTVFAEVPPRVEYRITPEGADLWTALEPLRQWGLRFKEADIRRA